MLEKGAFGPGDVVIIDQVPFLKEIQNLQRNEKNSVNLLVTLSLKHKGLIKKTLKSLL